MYGKGVINEGNVRKWCRFFKEGGKNVRNEERRGHPSLVTDDLKEKLKAKTLEKSRRKISELQEIIFRPDSEK
jgi:transposase